MLFIRFDFVNRFSFIFLGGLSIMFGSAGSLSNIMEHVGSIINSSNTNYAYQTIKSLIKDKVIVLIHIIIITSILIINYTSIHHILKLTSLNIKELTITVLISFLSVYWYEIVKFIKNNYQKQV